MEQNEYILPRKFVRIRHYGILSSTTKKTSIPIIKELFNEAKPIEKIDARILQNYHPLYCIHCKKESMIIVEIYQRRGPPNKAFSIDTMSNFTELKIKKVSTKENGDSCE